MLETSTDQNQNTIQQPHIFERREPYTSGARVSFQVDAQMIYMQSS